ncbi:hypothetical protein OROMI_009199 [Orobanche minor]
MESAIRIVDLKGVNKISAKLSGRTIFQMGHHTKFAHAIALHWMKPFDLVLQMMEGAFQQRYFLEFISKAYLTLTSNLAQLSPPLRHCSQARCEIRLFSICSRLLDDSRWKASICTLFGGFARGIAKVAA